ncbi:coenzyme F420-0:L-glutamate ligase [Hydrogeniiclostridium mannosilyticum]|uniref:coenzyme F420-0:L-glutamate ligase n=1 Tax=Hydrogeniiclostridium mannosilyticum TaxID=2764322 RepID=UPI0018AA4EBF|nr:coenzyme F420-0:L-glutamate ligase [Hydrogeniiclostridium mannosilyticum]
MRTVGTVSRGVRCPVIREGDDLVQIVTQSILECAEEQGIAFQDRDIVAVTEAVVARAQGNYATTDEIAQDCREKFGADEIAITFPIMSRNRIAICLKGIAKAFKKVYILMSYPSDEVGNHLFEEDLLDEKGVNPWSDVLDEKQYRDLFGYEKHPFTGVDYVEYFGGLFRSEGCEPVFIFGNDVRAVLRHTKNVLCCDIHTRERSRRRLLAAGAEKVLLLSDLMNRPVNGSGYNEQFGLLGSNKATEDRVKLFPRDCRQFVESLQQSLQQATGKRMEALIYGDGAFKDPVGKIWELADPVVSPAYTAGLEGQPNELKLKYLADNDFANLSGDELTAAIKDSISHKEADLKGAMASQGTTPRRLTDLIGSLCDLTSGSGDKGTPIIWIQGYFDNFAK